VYRPGVAVGVGEEAEATPGVRVDVGDLDAAVTEEGLRRLFRHPVIVGGGTPFLPPVTEDVPLDLIETRTFGSRVIYERFGRARDESD